MITFMHNDYSGVGKMALALHAVRTKLHIKVPQINRAIGKYILEESQKIVPWEDGVLHDSGQMREGGGGLGHFVKVGYGWFSYQRTVNGRVKKPYFYAWRAHELPTPSKPGRERKYLETVCLRLSDIRIILRIALESGEGT